MEKYYSTIVRFLLGQRTCSSEPAKEEGQRGKKKRPTTNLSVIIPHNEESGPNARTPPHPLPIFQCPTLQSPPLLHTTTYTTIQHNL